MFDNGISINTLHLLLNIRFVFAFSEKFSLPLAALWTAVLGDWNRDMEEHTEERIPIDEVVIHDKFHNYQNDIG